MTFSKNLKIEFECKNSLITSYLYSLSSNWVVWKVLLKFDESITLGPKFPQSYILDIKP